MEEIKTFPMKFRSFNIDEADKTGMTVLHDWVKTYDFQKEDSPFESFTNKIVTVYIWTSSGYDPKQNRTYGGMFAYAEVWREEINEVRCEQFFGETSEDDAFRWASDKTNEMLYK